MTNQQLPENKVIVEGLTVPLERIVTIAQLEDIIRQAKSRDRAVYPLGGGTGVHCGLPPVKQGSAVDLRSLDKVVDYPARDMTVTVQAGIAVADLQQLLAEENQRLPIDVPQAQTATLGGALALNACGLRRYGCGTLRDYVIGMSAVNDDGKPFKAGGRVVKNVAGYDLCKLFIGSLGTLGIVTQVTLKVVPRPEHSALVLLRAAAGKLDEILQRLHETQTRPVCIEALNRRAVTRLNDELLTLPQADWVIVAGFENNSEAVDWQLRQLGEEMHDLCPFDVFPPADAENLMRALADFPSGQQQDLTFRAAVPSSCCADYCRYLDASLLQPAIQSHAGNGIVIGHVMQDLQLKNAQSYLNDARSTAKNSGGRLIVERCPVDWKTERLIWGQVDGSIELMRTIKRKLDPQNIFNPGRFFGGI